MAFRLIDSGWNIEMNRALESVNSSVCIISPFIKRSAVEHWLSNNMPRTIQVITRFNLDEFYQGVSDTSAIRWLLENGAHVRGVRNLHAKLYIFDDRQAIVGSANLTEAALRRNYEFGFVADETDIVGRCKRYFEDMWSRAGKNLTVARLTEFERKIDNHRRTVGPATPTSRLGDEGTDAEALRGEIETSIVQGTTAPQAFVKFFHKSGSRADRSMAILELVRRSGCHWACTYPKNRRPRQVKDGAVMYMGCLANDPPDILIFGRGIGIAHKAGRDEANAADIQLRSWKRQWPLYIRVHNTEFIAGSIGNGISLNHLMTTHKFHSFATTQSNAAKRSGNIDPRKAYMRHPAVHLSLQGANYLHERFEQAINQYGKLPSVDMEQLDWPIVP